MLTIANLHKTQSAAEADWNVLKLFFTFICIYIVVFKSYAKLFDTGKVRGLLQFF